MVRIGITQAAFDANYAESASPRSPASWSFEWRRAAWGWTSLRMKERGRECETYDGASKKHQHLTTHIFILRNLAEPLLDRPLLNQTLLRRTLLSPSLLIPY